MKTVSAKVTKGQEHPRRWIDDLRLMRYALAGVFDYIVVGARVRKVWRAKHRAGEKYYLDEG